MTLKDVMDPIEWFEYASDRVERGLSIEDEEIERNVGYKPIKVTEPEIEPSWTKMLDPIQYFEYMSEKEGR